MPRSGSLEEVLVADVCFIVSKAVLPRLVAKCCAPKGNASSRRLAQGRPVNRVGTAPAASCAHLAARRDIQMRAQLAPVAGQACAPLLTARRPARVRRSRATGGASATARRSRSQASGRGARAPSPPSGTLRPRTLTTCRSPPGRSPRRPRARLPTGAPRYRSAGPTCRLARPRVRRRGGRSRRAGQGTLAPAPIADGATRAVARVRALCGSALAWDAYR